jgi:hypothetical protein
LKLIEKQSMLQNNKPTLAKKDVFSSAAITSLFTYILLGFSKSLEPEHDLIPYFSDICISTYAGILSVLLVFLLSLFRFRVNLILLDWKCTRKIKALDKLISVTTNQKLITNLKKQKDIIIYNTSKEIENNKL